MRDWLERVSNYGKSVNRAAPSGMESFREAIAIDRLNSHETKRNWLNPEKSAEKSYLRV
ncbi:MAG: hypothetical protein AB1861_23230 [Cyanobacteriota bacterium]